MNIDYLTGDSEMAHKEIRFMCLNRIKEVNNHSSYKNNSTRSKFYLFHIPKRPAL